jgi:hypothetical protein
MWKREKQRIEDRETSETIVERETERQEDREQGEREARGTETRGRRKKSPGR